MRSLGYFLVFSIVVIYAVTLLAITNTGWNWPVIFFGDILRLNWRSQFNVDFLIHLLLFATWISWREGFTPKGHVFGFLGIFMGGMFGFPYILVALYRAKGNPKQFFLGIHAE